MASSASSSAARRSHTPPSPPTAKKAKLELAPEPSSPVAAAVAPAPAAAAAAVADARQPIKNAPPPGPRKANVNPAKRGKVKRKPVDDVVLNEIKVFLGPEAVKAANTDTLDWEPPAGLARDAVVEVVTSGGVTAQGNVLALYTCPTTARPWALSTPFVLPGERIRVRIDGHSRLHSTCALVEVLEPSAERLKEGEGVGCKYFGTCGGCQFQHMSYDKQLALKRETVRRAFQYFSKLDPALVPEIGTTIPSPKQIGYRTKITPHFRPLPTPIRTAILTAAGLPLPPRKGTNPYAAAHAASSRQPSPTAESAPAAAPAVKAEVDEEESTNDMLATVGGPIDVSEDPSALPADSAAASGTTTPSTTRALIAGLDGGVDGSRFFERVAEDDKPKADDLHEFFIGFDERVSKKLMDIEECPLATPIINRQYALERAKITQIAASYAKDASLLLRDSADARSFGPDASVPEDAHVCVTDHKATVHERVGGLHFAFPAGSFFQNNNSILPSLTEYVRQAIFEPPATATVQTLPTHLVDTYCGSGLFAISLSPFFEQVTGIEVDPKSIAYAERNARLNAVEGKCTFKAGKSEEIFETVVGLPWDKTAVVIDPPRKGCDEGFLRQLVGVAPQTVVYVSCNVHTQARDVGFVLSQDVGGRKYVLESLRGFDLFPQTAHVEGVAVLRLQ